MTLFPEAGFVPTPAPAASLPGSSHFRLSEDSRCFDGHFDGAPILPGVIHVALALAACARETGTSRVLTGLRDVRFSRPLGPGDDVEVILADGREPSSVRFEIRVRGERATVGLLIFESLNEAPCD